MVTKSGWVVNRVGNINLICKLMLPKSRCKPATQDEAILGFHLLHLYVKRLIVRVLPA
jgi:hypothetical protein